MVSFITKLMMLIFLRVALTSELVDVLYKQAAVKLRMTLYHVTTLPLLIFKELS